MNKGLKRVATTWARASTGGPYLRRAKFGTERGGGVGAGVVVGGGVDILRLLDQVALFEDAGRVAAVLDVWPGLPDIAPTS
jgi:hypothetical protein